MSQLKRLLPVLLLATACHAHAQYAPAEHFRLDPQHSFARFEYDHWGLSQQQGRFDTTRGRVILAPGTEQGGQIEIEIDTGSISTGSDALDELLRSEDFFSAAQHPTISFRSTRMNYEAERLRSVEGELRIRGITQPVKLEVTHFNCRFIPIYLRRACGAHAQGTLLRSNYGMGRYRSFVSDEVRLSIVVEALQEAKPDTSQ